MFKDNVINMIKLVRNTCFCMKCTGIGKTIGQYNE